MTLGGGHMYDRILDIATDRITPNLRLIFAPQIIHDLCRSIMMDGQREPIATWFDGRRLKIMDGEKRWRACKRLGMARINVIIIKSERRTFEYP
jgi:ParB-like chromosome segregation protein Spo0J